MLDTSKNFVILKTPENNERSLLLRNFLITIGFLALIRIVLYSCISLRKCFGITVGCGYRNFKTLYIWMRFNRYDRSALSLIDFRIAYKHTAVAVQDGNGGTA